VPTVVPEPVMAWPLADAAALLTVIEGIDAEGLSPADYRPAALKAAIAAGEGPALDEVASRSFAWLAEDMRDGRTPMTARVQWFAVDPDQDKQPNMLLMEQALKTHDVPGVIFGLAPTHPDYAALRQALADTPPAQKARRAMIRANMDRWRWLARDLGNLYLMTNVPEFQLRLTKNNEIIKTYKTVVGKPGRTATPQLAETVEAVVFNPTWTVPQSIVVGEGLGARLIGNPANAARQGYKAFRAANGTITVVQQPGPSNALGLMKIDFPNPHAIFMHDTPSKAGFNAAVRAFSHGCVRTERAVELGMTLAIYGAGLDINTVVAKATSGKYDRVVMTRQLPVYITYFTMGTDISGRLSTFADIYGRDAPVLASLAAPRQLKTTQRKSNEAIIKLDNPL
jgi:murein L,D-transpeptidase YcbB/YkuD